MKISTGKKGVDGDKLSRRLELVRDLRLTQERSTRRFRIGLADDLFSKSATVTESGPSTEPELPVGTPTSAPLIHREELPGVSQTELLIGLAAITGLTLGFLIGKRWN